MKITKLNKNITLLLFIILAINNFKNLVPLPTGESNTKIKDIVRLHLDLITKDKRVIFKPNCKTTRI